MNYKLDAKNNVIRLSDNAYLPCSFEDGKVVPKDPYSPFVKEFQKWVDAGNVPEPATIYPVDPEPSVDEKLTDFEARLAALEGKQ